MSGTIPAAIPAVILIAIGTTLIGGCTVNTFNCNVKEACRPDATAPAAPVAPPAAR